MVHLRGRVRIVRVVGRGYVLHRWEGWLKLVISDYVGLRSILPGCLGDRLFRAVSLVRSFHLFVVSGKEKRVKGGGLVEVTRGMKERRYLLNIHCGEVVVGAGT